jgi:hypothetical protein
MRIRMFITALLLAAFGVTLSPQVAASSPAQAAPSSAASHCSITVVGQKPSGELVTTSPRCFATTALARSYVPPGTSAAVQNVLAIHYKQTGYNGPSLTVNGNSCVGGWVNFSGSLASWRNSIVSTRNVFCPVTRHWSGFNKTGAVDVHYAWEVNLGSLIGATSSASYHSS